MKNKLFVCGVLMLMLSSCADSGLYSWHDYEDLAYKNSKVSTDKSAKKLLEEYETMMKRQRGIRRTVPPGLCAEYGYMLIKQNKIEEGKKLLQKEVVLYPESEVFIKTILKQLEK